MKQLKLFILFCLTVAIATAQPINDEVGADGSSKNLLGKINKEGLTSEAYASWFNKNYDSYKPDMAVINAIEDALKSYTIELFMGTWCGDSKREVPRFYKVLEAANFPMHRLTAIAVDRERGAYKESPGGEHEAKNIHRVPTFIFYKNGREVNRIVEHPVNTIEKDIRDILQNNYKSNYYAVTVVDEALNEMGLVKFSKKEKKIVAKIESIVTASKELNTYAYLLFNRGDREAANAVARLNISLFPEEARVYGRLAAQLSQTNNPEEAIEMYEKALSLDPENSNYKSALEMLKNADSQ